MHAQEFDFETIDTVEEDKFCFKIEVKDKPQTRRGLLSVICCVSPTSFCGPGYSASDVDVAGFMPEEESWVR